MKRAPRLVQGLAVVGALTLTAGGLGLIVGLRALRSGLGTQEEPSVLEARAARAMRALAVPDRLRALKNAQVTTPEVLAQARAHWADHCAICHANDGSGQTQIGERLYPRAPDMRQPSTQALSDGELYGIIQNGIRLTGMPGWGKADDDADTETWALVAFIRHLPVLSPSELRAMEHLNPKPPGEQREVDEEDSFLNDERLNTH